MLTTRSSGRSAALRWPAYLRDCGTRCFPDGSVIGVNNATIGRILRDNGYATSWFGKDHNTPTYQASQVGPFTQWPTGMGFDYFYGFVGGDVNQWGPNLFRNTTQIYPWIGHEGTLKMDRSDPKAEIWPVSGKEPS